jgi:aryl-alcohol dehydrogenase-like predicted oxidoreductase
MPRFEPETYARNLPLLQGFAALAKDAGCTMAQLALAWILARGEHVIALPGTTQVDHLIENLGAGLLRLGADVLARADALINQQTVAGPRYTPSNRAEVDTEQFQGSGSP